MSQLPAMLESLFQEGTPDVVPKIINGSLVVRTPPLLLALPRPELTSSSAPAAAAAAAAAAVRQVLLVTLVAMSYMFPHLASIHIYVMGFLALGLLASVNWLLSELKKGTKEAARAGAAPGVAGQLRERDAAPAKAMRGKTD